MTTDWQKTAIETKDKLVAKKAKVGFKTLAEAKTNRGIKILSYGNFSTGKTHSHISLIESMIIVPTSPSGNDVR